MKYYIKSAGIAPDHDYVWKLLNNDSGQEGEVEKNYPDFVNEFFINKNVDPDSCLITLVRNTHKHLCLMARFKSKYTDYQRRNIYNYFALESTSNSDDDAVKVLTSMLLKDRKKITSTINTYINPTSTGYGFKINGSELIKKIVNISDKGITRYCINKTRQNNNRREYNNKCQIAQDLDDNRKCMADNILKNCPSHEGIIALVSNAMSKKSFEQVDGLVWGLSSSIDESEWGFIPLECKPNKGKIDNDKESESISKSPMVEFVDNTVRFIDEKVKDSTKKLAKLL